jgi:type II secretory pathway component PulF
MSGESANPPSGSSSATAAERDWVAATVLVLALSGGLFVARLVGPSFETVFNELGLALPAPTALVLDYAAAMRSYGIVIAALHLGAAWTAWRYAPRRGRALFDCGLVLLLFLAWFISCNALIMPFVSLLQGLRGP